jgi:uncharacterized membrane protein
MKYLIALLAVAGIVVSTMALRVHYMDPGLAPPCAVTEKFDCGAVNHSRFAVFPPHTFDEDPKAGHIPIAMFGIVGYAAIGVVALMGRWWLVFEFAQLGFLFAAFRAISRPTCCRSGASIASGRREPSPRSSY